MTEYISITMTDMTEVVTEITKIMTGMTRLIVTLSIMTGRSEIIWNDWNNGWNEI